MSVAGDQDRPAGSSQTTQEAPDGDGPRPAAPGGWFNCTVNRVGPTENGSIFVHLREVNGKFDRWYEANSTVKKEMLATALTAISSGLRVAALLTTPDEYGKVNRLYVTR